MKLGNLVTIVGGGTPSRKNEEYWDGDIPWISVKDFKSNKITNSLERITQKGLDNSSAKLIPKGNVIIPTRMALGKVAINEIDTAINQDLKALIIKEPEVLDLKYLLYFLKSKAHFIESSGKGATVKGITIDTLANLDMELPSIKLQKKIINALELSQALVEKRKAQILALSSLTQSLFFEMFGDPNENKRNWNKKEIGEIFEVNTGATPSRKNDAYWENGNIPWVKTTELKDKSIIDVQEFITNKALENTNTKLFPKDTILIAMYGQGRTRGRTGRLTRPAATNQACAAIIPNKNVNYTFLWYQLIIQYETLRNLARGGNQPNLNLSMIKQFEIILPPKELQDNFSDIIVKIEKQKKLIEKSLIHFENNFNSLMQLAFKGELFKD